MEKARYIQVKRREMAFMLPDEILIDPHIGEVIDRFEAEPGALVCAGGVGECALIDPGVVIDRPHLLAPIRLIGIEDRLQMSAFRNRHPV